MPTELQKVVRLPLNTAACFSARTRRRLERALGRTALVPPPPRDALRHAVGVAVDELFTQGVDPGEIETIMRQVVDEAGVAHGAFGSSLVTRVPRWREVEDDVLRWARFAVTRLLHPSEVPRRRPRRRL